MAELTSVELQRLCELELVFWSLLEPINGSKSCELRTEDSRVLEAGSTAVYAVSTSLVL